MRIAITDILALLCVQTISFCVRVLPAGVMKTFFHGAIRLFLRIQPKHIGVAETNIAIVFPNMSPSERKILIQKHIQYLTIFLYESFRLPQVTEEWIENNVQFPSGRENFLAEEYPQGTLFLTGHIGVFELLSYAMSLKGYPLHVVVRKFPSPRLERWWRSIRECHGNTVIERSGAYREILHVLKRGERVGLLFDQNITLSRAVFPNWFGVPAATTKAVGFSILKTNPHVVVLSLVQNRSGKYEILLKECHLEDVVNDTQSSRDEKVLAITQRVTDLLASMIEEFPEQWFWFHRRWKTRPDGTRYPY